MKVSLLMKNSYPEIYGYEHPWDIPGNEDCGAKNPINKGKKKGEYPDFRVPFIDTLDLDGMTRYAPCSKELMQWDVNEKWKEKRRNDLMTRCMVESNRKGLVRCMKNCNHCPLKKNPKDPNEPYERRGGVVSLNYLFDEFEFEFPDDEEEAPFEKIERELLLDEIKELVKQRCELDQQIASLFDLSDRKLAKRLNKPWTTIRDHRNRMIKEIREILQISKK